MKCNDRETIERRYNGLESEQRKHISVWKDIKRYLKPKRGFFEGDQPNDGNAIDHKTQLNGAPGRALRTLAAGLMSGLTSPSRPWFKLGLQDDELEKNQSVKEWLGDCEQRMMGIFAKSNIYGVLHTGYEEIASFGTECSMILEDYDSVIRGTSFTAGEYMIGLGPDGRPNAFARQYQMTVGQLVDEFGKENVTPSVQNSYDRKDLDKWIKVRQLIEKNDGRDPGMVDSANMPYRSVHWEVGSPKDTCLRYSGFEQFPVVAPRWDVTTTSTIYGSGPGHDSLGDTKMLMKMEKEKLIALAKVVNPPMQQDGTVDGDINTLPGGVTRTSAMTPNAGARPAYQINPDLNAIQNAIDRTVQSIERTCFADLFLMLAQMEDGGKMTAREVVERHEEKLIMLGPVLDRFKSELLDPLVERTFNICLRVGALLPPPPIMQGADIKIEYISMLAQAQKMVDAIAIEKVLSFVATVIGADPNAGDNVDFDEAINKYADIHGIPAKIIRSPDAVAAIRKMKQQQQQAAAAAQMAGAAVEAGKTLSETRLNNGSALDELLNVGPTRAAA